MSTIPTPAAVQRPVTTEPALSGATIVGLMRARRITIRALAKRMNITLTRVRHVRTHGVCGVAFVRDWLDAIERC
jgi:tRNA A37 threonylcarbamoyltransferase TsaD